MDQHNLNLTALPASVCGPAETFATTLIAEIADNLRSISVVGSSLTEDFRPGHSDINTVVVLGERTLAALNSIAALARPMSKKKIASPLL